MKSHRVVLVGLLVPLIFCSSLSAQTDQPFALQVSGVALNSMQDAELGLEGQIRWTRGAWSLGAGVQYTFIKDFAGPENFVGAECSEELFYDYDASTLGLFLEPKFVALVFGDRFGLYVSGRVAVSRITENESGASGSGGCGVVPYSFERTLTNTAAYLGLGLLVRLTSRVNLDLGATWGYRSWEVPNTVLVPTPHRIRSELDFEPAVFGAWIGLVIGIG